MSESQPALAPGLSAIRAHDDVVLASMALKDGTDRAKLSRFHDDIWDIDPAIIHVTARNAFRTIDFSGIACPIERLTAKEYIYAWLNELLPDRAGRLRPLSTRTALATLCRFMAFVRERVGRFDVRIIDQALLDGYLAELRARNVQPSRVAACLRPIVQLRRLAPFLSHGGLRFVPWHGRAIYTVAGCKGRPSENLTPRIPEPVIGALIRWSLKYIDIFAADIFAARAELDALETAYAERPASTKHSRLADRMAEWTAARRLAGRGVPVWNRPQRNGGMSQAIAESDRYDGHVVNMRLIAMQAGIHPTTLSQPNMRALVLSAIEELGIEHGGMDTLITLDPDSGRPWRERFDAFDLVREERHLQTAAYILCSYLTGMRDGEIQAMRPNCIKRGKSADGRIERIAVQSMIYKGRGTHGEIEEWVTIAPVARAVEVAERLARRHRAPHQHDGLWIVLERGTAVERTLPHIVQQINRYREHLDAQYGSVDMPAVPLVDGRNWVFNTRQFRRTLAWYIANRPFGVVAGKIQYKHASVAMFDGYAGASASGFRQEVEQERALGQLDDIVVQYEGYRNGERLAGPAGARITAEMMRVATAAELPGIVADEKRVKAMLAHLARTLHVGVLNDCFFDRATALCLRSANEGAAPRLSNCAPDRCPNSCITSRHVPAWQSAIDDAEAVLKSKRLSAAQRTAIRADRDRMKKVIALWADPAA
ncbi:MULTISPECIES: hypothetical protein [Novosphingobium]|uniref:Integrase n=2 Tax=Novosphingobium TaxID=165696 RepID=G6EDE0_9SPHN|nr:MULTISPECIES: hypothetical protein [Novosphingobium]AIT79768.1 hypothetical protein JI59_08240 [Novosphingobium pentaromativorans US6-1]EHJ60670.1 hypothetical protein NSU_2367 [Novosphingobium pentaromativorans US6-1]SLK10235.1 hypothetical protein SAMN06295987_11123 [Novosphingobium mathurense]